MAKGTKRSEIENNRCRKIPFDVLPRTSLDISQLTALLECMRMSPHENGGIEAASNEAIPAGFTYFGQFIAHDLITDRDFPTLRLEPLYGGGSEQSPRLYVRFESELPERQWTGYQTMGFEKAFNAFDHTMMRVYRTATAYDVPREEESTDRNGKSGAEMGNAANDRNFVLAQLHCAFIRFHNAVVAWLVQQDETWSGDALLAKAQEIVIRHFQWVVVHQYLYLLAGENLVNQLLHDDQAFRFFNPSSHPVLMPEFTHAALRMGHSQIREIYIFPLLPPEKPTAFHRHKRVKLFASSRENQEYEAQYTEYRKQKADFHAGVVATPPIPPAAAQYLGDMRGGIHRNNLRMDWSFFFDFTRLDSTKEAPQPSFAIDHKLASPIYDLFFLKERKSLPQRDILAATDLPSGHSVALAYSVLYPDEGLTLLTSEQVFDILGIGGLRVEDLPLWVYILLEAEIQHAGTRLGGLGARILAEQIIWVLKKDPKSFLHAKDDFENAVSWEPESAFIQWRSDRHPDAVGASANIQKFCLLDILQFPDYFFNAESF